LNTLNFTRKIIAKETPSAKITYERMVYCPTSQSIPSKPFSAYHYYLFGWKKWTKGMAARAYGIIQTRMMIA